MLFSEWNMSLINLASLAVPVQKHPSSKKQPSTIRDWVVRETDPTLNGGYDE